MTSKRKQPVRAAVIAAVAIAGLGMAACDDDPAPLFEIPGTGSLEGLVFFDADRNGLFDPAAGDFALPDARVELRERGTQQTLAGASATADAEGRFVIDDVRPGTHDLVVDTLSIPEGTRFCQNPVPVDILVGEVQFRNVSGRFACIVTIAEAEQTRNETVVIQGLVSSFPGETRGQYTYIQDETGGIRIFSAALEGRGIERGDLVEVTGEVLEFSRDLQLGGTVVVGSIQKDVQQVQPQEITTGELAAAAADPAAPELGILVTIRAARIDTPFGGGGINGRNVWIDDGSGRAQIRFETNTFPAASTGDAQTQLNALYPVGNCYDVTGVTGLFNNDAQVFPRTLDDLVPVPCT